MIAAVVTGVLIIAGAAFAFVAALGVWRMPDTYTRMHAAAKAGPLGAGLLLVGVAVDTGDGGAAVRALAVVAFLLLTAPVGAHLVARAIHRSENASEPERGDT